MADLSFFQHYHAETERAEASRSVLATTLQLLEPISHLQAFCCSVAPPRFIWEDFPTTESVCSKRSVGSGDCAGSQLAPKSQRTERLFEEAT